MSVAERAAVALDALIIRVAAQRWQRALRRLFAPLGRRLLIPACERCDLPIWSPVFLLFVDWRRRRYHYACLRTVLTPTVSGAARWTPDMLED